MVKYLAAIFLLAGCTGNNKPETLVKIENAALPDPDAAVHYDRLREYFLSADSVVLFSHVSPNEPVKNLKTGKYYPNSIPFIENEEINYENSVQERKRLNKPDIEALVNILVLPAVQDSVFAMCFQPRHAVLAYNEKRFAGFDFCFECTGVAPYGNSNSQLIMNFEKYSKLRSFFKKKGFKYELD